MVENLIKFNKVLISSHYEENHGFYMNDGKILKIVKQLNKKNDFIPHRQGKLSNGIEGQSFFGEPFFLKDKTKEKAYRLVGYGEIGNPILLIIHCHRRSKYEK